jgi:TPP-dependent pyruvate/acetoin dehydrogenase alpha subunit
MTEAIDRARRGDGPNFFEMKTYRYRGHLDVGCAIISLKMKWKNTKIDPITQVLDIIKDKNTQPRKKLNHRSKAK